MHRLAFAGLLATAALFLGSGSAAALTLGFDCLSNNIAVNCDIGEAQLSVEITAGPGANQVSFTFTNSGPEDSSIADVYFDDGTLLGIASILDGTGVDFAEGASPGNPPAANDANPVFVASFAADSNPPVQPNGVNPGEMLTIVFDLQGGLTLADTEAAIGDGSLRIGIHVQGFEEEDGSESFVNVPEPGLALLLGAPLLALARSRRRP
jgi:hypothetical protein